MNTSFVMTTPKGGRGKKAPYRTIQVRCPEPLKKEVAQLIERYHSQQQSHSVISKSEHIPPFQSEGDAEKLKARIAELDEENSRLKRELHIESEISQRNFRERNEMWERFQEIHIKLSKIERS